MVHRNCDPSFLRVRLGVIDTSLEASASTLPPDRDVDRTPRHLQYSIVPAQGYYKLDKSQQEPEGRLILALRQPRVATASRTKLRHPEGVNGVENVACAAVEGRLGMLKVGKKSVQPTNFLPPHKTRSGWQRAVRRSGRQKDRELEVTACGVPRVRAAKKNLQNVASPSFDLGISG